MRRVGKVFSLIALAVISLLIYFVSWVWYDKKSVMLQKHSYTLNNRPVITAYQTPLPNQFTPTSIAPSSTSIPRAMLEPFSNWKFFNQNYQSANDRNFRFKYPPVFTIRDWSSDWVWLEIDGEQYLGVDFHDQLTDQPTESIDIEKKFQSYYSYWKERRKNLPDLTAVERFDFGKHHFAYKFTENRSNFYFGVASPDKQWDRYLVIVNGNIANVIDFQKLPEDVVLEIIQSIEFDQNVQN